MLIYGPAHAILVDIVYMLNPLINAPAEYPVGHKVKKILSLLLHPCFVYTTNGCSGELRVRADSPEHSLVEKKISNKINVLAHILKRRALLHPLAYY